MNRNKQPYPKVSDEVRVIQKKHYRTGQLTEGIVKEVLTKKRFHPRGHKVRLESGVVGRVQEFIDINLDAHQSNQINPHQLNSNPLDEVLR